MLRTMDSLDESDDKERAAAMASALDALWARFLPEIRERAAVLESAATGFEANALTITQREDANSAAHKLAGVLGTFGLTRGTVLARELEVMYSHDTGPDAAIGERLASITVELKKIVEGRRAKSDG